jgi:hypothetical protein
MLRDEPVVGDASVADRAGEHTTHGDLALTAIAQVGDRIATVTQGVATIVHQPLGGTITLDERPNSVGAPPPIRPLAARVGAVDPTSPWPIDLDDGLGTRGTLVIANDIARHVDLLRTVDCSTHASIMTKG